MVGSTCETQFKSFRLNKKLVSSTRRERMSTAGLRWGDVDGGGYAEWNRCLAYMDWVWMMLMRCGIHVRNDEKHQVELLLICRTLCKSCYMEVVFSHSDPFTSKQSVLMNDAPNIPFFRSVFVDSADIYMSLQTFMLHSFARDVAPSGRILDKSTPNQNACWTASLHIDLTCHSLLARQCEAFVTVNHKSYHTHNQR